MNRLRGGLGPAGAFVAVAVLYWFFVALDAHAMIGWWRDPHMVVLTATQDLPQKDFARFWDVGRVLVLRRLGEFGFAASPSPWMLATFHVDLLASTGNTYQDWLYPPTMNLLGMLASLLPLPVSFFVWDLVSLGLAAGLLRRAGLDWGSIGLGLAGTASVQNFVMGQNGVLTGGLLFSALLWCERRPLVGGGLAGVLCIKPQIALVLGGIFLQPRRWGSLAACVAVGAGLVALSVGVEGWQAWSWFIHVGEPCSARVLQTPFKQNLLVAGATVFFMARSFYAGLTVAYALQGVCSVAAFAAIWALWRGPAEQVVERVALTLCLAVFVSPYGYFYDLVGYSVGMAAMFLRVPHGRKPVYALLWLAPGYMALLTAVTGHIFMPVAAAIGAVMVWREMALAPVAPETLPRVHSPA